MPLNIRPHSLEKKLHWKKLNSEVLTWALHREIVSPTSKGACAVILANKKRAKKITPKPIWISGVGWNLDTSYWTNRDLAYPQYVENAARLAYKMAGIKEPKKQINIVEPYDPFAYKECHHLEGLLLADKGKAPQLAIDGVTQRTGNMPSCQDRKSTRLNS